MTCTFTMLIALLFLSREQGRMLDVLSISLQSTIIYMFLVAE